MSQTVPTSSSRRGSKPAVTAAALATAPEPAWSAQWPWCRRSQTPCGHRSSRRAASPTHGIAAAFVLGTSGVHLGTAFLGCPRSAAALRGAAQCSERRRYRGDPRLYRSPGPRYTQSLCSRDGRCRGPRVSIASEHRRPALASARRPRPRRVDAGLGGPGRGTDARAAGTRAGRQAGARNTVGIGAIDVVPSPSGRHGL